VSASDGSRHGTLRMTFRPVDEREEIVAAAAEYGDIWAADGERILAAITQVTGLDVGAGDIGALVHPGVSRAHPVMALRSTLSRPRKQATLVHEVCHVVMRRHGLQGRDPVEDHRRLCLFLLDVWSAVYGEEFAAASARSERSLGFVYRVAWEWVEPLGRSARAAAVRWLTAHPDAPIERSLEAIAGGAGE
jgi:hypothetical protein